VGSIMVITPDRLVITWMSRKPEIIWQSLNKEACFTSNTYHTYLHCLVRRCDKGPSIA
jgi:hypothetical protein